ncbi:MAG: ABC transporter permease subunit [Acidimicrobiia bacterium]|nr:ABC transporter permease subunit [Acidimicrobiia bacterium]
MARFIIRRLVYSAITLLFLSLTVFMMVRLSGDPARLLAGQEASAEDVAALRADLGLDRPLPVQYAAFLGDAVRGDFGQSFNFRVPVRDLYFDRLPFSLQLAGAAFLISIFVGIPAGIVSAVRPRSRLSSAAKVVGLAGLAIPNFVIALVLMYILSVQLELLPTSGSGSWKQLIMPAISLGWYFAASMMRLVSSSLLEIAGSDYVKLARLKGMPERVVVLKHALKNALLPVLTLAGVNFVVMVNAAVVVESIFSWPGIGDLVKQGIDQRDFPLVQGVVLLAAAMVVLVNLLVDIAYAWVDPRIRLER